MVLGEFNKYRGYRGTIEFTPDDKYMNNGHLIDTEDLVCYCGNTIEELYEQFKLSVDNYIILCGEIGKEINK